MIHQIHPFGPSRSKGPGRSSPSGPGLLKRNAPARSSPNRPANVAGDSAVGSRSRLHETGRSRSTAPARRGTSPVAFGGTYWRVLFGHLITFGFIDPAGRGKIPARVLDDLADRLKKETEGPAPQGQVCFGTVLSREQYLVDTGTWGYQDARLKPRGEMSPEEVAHWTASINSD